MMGVLELLKKISQDLRKVLFINRFHPPFISYHLKPSVSTLLLMKQARKWELYKTDYRCNYVVVHLNLYLIGD